MQYINDPRYLSEDEKSKAGFKLDPKKSRVAARCKALRLRTVYRKQMIVQVVSPRGTGVREELLAE